MPKTSEPRPLLLDTHVWVWLMLADEELTLDNRDVINAAAAVGGLRVAAITLWEVAMLASRGRLSLDLPLPRWIEAATSVSGLVIEPLEPRIAIESVQLPSQFHRDPADRMIVATARVTGAVLMTRDRRILNYAGLGHLEARPA
jgi:PIN domain nuclease of toxin-antitoxin system